MGIDFVELRIGFVEFCFRTYPFYAGMETPQRGSEMSAM